MLSLVIPVYKNEASIPALLDAVAGMDRQLPGGLEAVFVVDGSPDRSYERLREALPTQPFRSRLVLLSRNFGAFMAIRTGLQYGARPHYAVMAADLQEPPELVLEIAQVLREEPIDVVVGARASRDDPFFSRLASDFFWRMYRRYVVPEMPPGGVDMFGCNQAFRDALLSLEERHSSLIAQIFWLGFRRKVVSYSRVKREHGKSAWTLRKKVDYMLDSIFAFSDLPVRLLSRVGLAGSLLAIALGVFVFFARLAGMIEEPGYAMTMIVITLLGSLNLMGLGIVGSYAWRVYENTKKRPLAIPMKVDEFGVQDHA